ncbi:Receptor-like protein 12 [Vitis vinifera]|uniref:Receptor-like protein 12 n=1 Tax=Vitis vinifera TaxID=29760 RepID=A0A438H2V2_VITVI|nr:Receptor-like protein 12 [Vitis vinifera]
MAVRSFEQLLSFLVLLLLCVKPGLGTTLEKVGCIEGERQALLKFKRGLVDDYGLLSLWGDEQDKRDCCRWRGVRCNNRSGHVIMLRLPAPPIDEYGNYQSLRGEISPSLLELEHLNHLDLSYNDFEGKQIPSFLGSLSKMQYLNLSYAKFAKTIPTQLGNLSNLLSLDLSAIHWSQAINKLPSLVHLNLYGCGLPPFTTGSLFHANSSAPLVFLDLSNNYLINSSIYPWLFNFSTTLVHLDLSSNDLNGSIPDAFGNMISLAYLNLRDCAFEGEIPFAFGGMSALEYLDISGHGLHGEIPDTFGNMTSLAYLALSSNQLQGGIPDAVGDLASLTYLELFGNQLKALPKTFGRSLVHVDISSNQMKGSIPDTFGNMVSLEELFLSHNQLEGEIPKSFGRSLVILDLSSNRLQGSIPDTVGDMVSLERLSLSVNQLQGEIPKSFSNLCNLQEVELDSNNLTGQLPQDLLACANGTLRTLSLSDNRFRGLVPHLIGFSFLERLYLDYNQLNGTLPESIGQLAKLTWFDIGSNSLQGVISEAHFFNLSNLYRLDLSYNSLTFNMSLEWVPPSQLDVLPDWFWNLTSNINTLNISNNQIRGVLPNLSSQFGTYPDIDISSNSFEGSIPQLPSTVTRLDLSNNKLSGSISLLCIVANSYLVYLDLSNNSLTGALPNCWPQWASLVVLNLENNKFSGKIPNSLGSLQLIQTLHLRSNNLTGELPSSLKNCTSLRLIDLGKNRLSGKIPLWIGGSLPNLTILSLRSNQFSGSICSELCQLKKIQILDLSSNDISGVIPRCLNNFTAMTKKGSLVVAHNYSFGSSAYKDPLKFKNESYVDEALIKWKGSEFEYKNTLGLIRSIDLSRNNLLGEIPKEITDLLELVSLNLSRNNLTGLIPTTIGQLKSLEILDLSQNELFGEIPTSLSEISLLSVLDLSNNNLSGKIPKGTQLQSFNSYSYKGNPTLCGLPLLKKCPEDEMKQDSPTRSIEDKIQQDGNGMWFYISIALGFIVGFWGVCGTLLLNNSLRYAYFHFLNKIKDWFYVTIAINMAKDLNSFFFSY